MPRRTRSHTLEDLSIAKLHQTFDKKGWTVEDLRKDYGEDLLVRLFKNGETTPLSFFVQAKATDNLSCYLNKDRDMIRFPVETGHVRHWVRFSEPVILTVWDSHTYKTYWVCIQDVLEPPYRIRPVSIGKGRTMRISVPYTNLLNADGLKRIEGITKLRFNRQKQEKEGSLILLEQLRKAIGRKVDFESDGLLTIHRSDGGADALFFGDLAKVLVEYSKKTRMSPKKLIKVALSDGLKNIEKESKANFERSFSKMLADRERKAAEDN